MKISIHQQDITIGDLDTSKKRILECLGKESSNEKSIHLFPELFLGGYPLQDLILDKSFIENYQRCLKEIDEHFKSASVENNNCFLYFTATWCNPCKYAKPIIFDYVKLLKEKNLDFKFIMIDADEGRDVSSCMKVRGFPTLQFYHGSELHETCLGAGEEDLKAFFNASYHKML